MKQPSRRMPFGKKARRSEGQTTDREEAHMNISRYISGVCPKFRQKQMEVQLRNLLNVNDSVTLPNPNGRSSNGRVIFPTMLSKQ